MSPASADIARASRRLPSSQTLGLGSSVAPTSSRPKLASPGEASHLVGRFAMKARASAVNCREYLANRQYVPFGIDRLRSFSEQH